MSVPEAREPTIGPRIGTLDEQREWLAAWLREQQPEDDDSGPLSREEMFGARL